MCTIPGSFKTIPDLAFFECDSLTTVNIPLHVSKIGKSAFLGCSNLSEVIIPESVKSIGSGAFCECVALKSITIPESVVRIESNAFRGCSNLSEVNIPESVNFIGSGAFSGCEALESIQIPKGVTEVENGVFVGCKNLKNITIPKSLEGKLNLPENVKIEYYPEDTKDVMQEAGELFSGISVDDFSKYFREQDAEMDSLYADSMVPDPTQGVKDATENLRRIMSQRCGTTEHAEGMSQTSQQSVDYIRTQLINECKQEGRKRQGLTKIWQGLISRCRE